MSMDDPFNQLASEGSTLDARFPPIESYAADMPLTAALPPFVFTQVGQLNCTSPEFIIEGLIEADTLGLIFGDPGCGKSFFAVDLALSVASGTDFHGRSVRAGPVFYIAGEGHSGLARRFHAWALKREQSLKNVPLFKSERAAQFLDAQSAQAVKSAVQELSSAHGSPALIVIDTLARNFGGGDENNTSEMGEFVAAMDELRANWLGCSILIVHHTGHSDKARARGSIALKGAVDYEYRIEKSDSTISVTNTKMKDAEPPEPLHFLLTAQPLAGDMHSAVLVSTDAPPKNERLTGGQKLAVEAFKKCVASSAGSNEADCANVNIEDWRQAFYAMQTSGQPSSKAKAFQRATKALDEKGIIRCNGNTCSSKPS